MGEPQRITRLIFTGRVQPERIPLTVVGLPAFPLPNTSAGYNAIVQLNINNSLVSIIADVDGFAPDKVPTIRNHILESLAFWVDIHGFIYGAAYSMELSTCIDPGNARTWSLAPALPQLGLLAHTLWPYRQGGQGPFIPFHLSQDNSLVAALADLRRSLIYPAHTGFHCYRAMEHLRTGVDPGSASNSKSRRKQGWSQFRGALRVDESLLNYIERASDSPRHGSLPWISGEKRVRLMEESWRITDRYIAYLRVQKTALPEDQYPPLVRGDDWPQS